MTTETIITAESPIIVELLRGDGANGELAVAYGTDDTGRQLVRICDGVTRWIGLAAEWEMAVDALIGTSDYDYYSRACSGTPLLVNIHGCGARSSLEEVARACGAGLLDGRETLTILGRDGHIGEMSETEGDKTVSAIDAEYDAAKRAAIVRGLSRFTV